MGNQKLTAVIIDDMELARTSLKADLQDYCPEIEIIGEAEGVLSGAKLLAKVNPEILFLDIEMEDGNGFDLLDIISQEMNSVIFVTAKEDYAVRAFQYSAFNYLLKPVDPELLKAAVSRISIEKSNKKEQIAILREGMGKNAKLSRIALHTSEQILVVELDDIVRLEADANYTVFYFADKTKLMITKTLKEYDKMLSDANFARVHQSHLINLKHVKAYVKTEGGYISMKDESIVPVSVRKKPYVVKLLG